MEISKLSKTQAAEQVQEFQAIDSQSNSTTETQSLGFTKDNSLESFKTERLADLFATSSEENASDQSGLSAYAGGSNTQHLGNSGNATSSASYAQQKDKNSEGSESESSQLSRKEIADALGLPESDPAVGQAYTDALLKLQAAKQEADRLEANQQIINDALTHGRRIDEKLMIGDQEVHMFTEYVPSSSGDLQDAVTRTGLEYVNKSIFGDSITRVTKYFDANGKKLGMVESVIKGGEEEITKVFGEVDGAIALKPGDTRTIPDPTGNGGVQRPSTWDPQPDGRYGTTNIKGVDTTGCNDSSKVGDSTGETGQAKDGSFHDATSPEGEKGSGDVGSDPSEWNAYPGEEKSSDSGSDPSEWNAYPGEEKTDDSGSGDPSEWNAYPGEKSGDGGSGEAASDPSEWNAWPGSGDSGKPGDSSGQESGSSGSGNAGVTAKGGDTPGGNVDSGGPTNLTGWNMNSDGTVTAHYSNGSSENYSNIAALKAAHPDALGGGSGSQGSVQVGPDQLDGGGKRDGDEDGTSSSNHEPTFIGGEKGDASGDGADGATGAKGADGADGTPTGADGAEEGEEYIDPDQAYAGAGDGLTFGAEMKLGFGDRVRPDMGDQGTMDADPSRTPGYGVTDTTPEIDDYSSFIGEPDMNKLGPGGDPVRDQQEAPAPNPDTHGTDPYSHND